MDKTHSEDSLDWSRNTSSSALKDQGSGPISRETDRSEHDTKARVSTESPNGTLNVGIQFGGELNNIVDLIGDECPDINKTEGTELSQRNEHKEVDSEIAVKPKKVRQRLWTVILSAIVACIPFLLVGSTLGFPSGALLDLTDLEDRPDYKLSRELADLFGALGYIGAVFGGPIAGWISDRMGRKPALMLVSVPYLIGYIMMAYAHLATDAVVFKVILLIGRFFSGVGLGWASLAVVVYVVEISPSKQRGRIGSIVQLFLVIGILTIYTLSSFKNFRYSDSSLVLVGFVALFTVSMTFFCETPQWLLSRGQKERAIAVLKFLRGPKYDIKGELEIMQSKISGTKKLRVSQVFREFTKCSVLVPQLLVLLLTIFRVCGGLESINSFSATILRDAGVQGFRQVSVYGTGCTRLVANFTVLFFADFLGRKVLLIASGIGMFIGTTILGAHFYITRPALCLSFNSTTNASLTEAITTSSTEGDVLCNTYLAPVAIVGLIVFNIGFSIGWGPILWVLLGELLPRQVRGIGTGIATFSTWGLASLVVGSYLSFANATQPWFVWWTYSVVNLVGVVFVGFCIFETKGKSLEDIQHRFETKYGEKNVIPSCCTASKPKESNHS